MLWFSCVMDLAAIYFRLIGTVLAVSLKIVPAVGCCGLLCTPMNKKA